jgi:predicted transposase/invertase (TIGR01784 family)
LFDNISKFLVTEYSVDFASWLLGREISLTTLNPTELNLEPIRADAVVLMSAPELVLHLEFQTDADPEMPLRMADYYIRLRRKFPHREIEQVVIYLRRTGSDLVRQSEYSTTKMNHQFRVVRLWEEEVSNFLTTPGLLPYAVLAKTVDKEAVLQQVIERIQQVGDRRQESNLTAATGILAGLELSQAIIRRLIRSEIMQESVIYQEILREGEARGRADEGRALITRLLTRKFGNIAPELVNQVNQLSIEQLESLGEALLDFSSIADLENYLASHR